MARGPHDAVVSYHVHRMLVVAIAGFLIAIMAGVVVFEVPAVRDFADAAIQAVHGTWRAMHWNLL
jgi:hypothetical protein